MRGFTLVELLGVLVIIGIIAVITIPAVSKIINDSKTDSYNEQVRQIESSARSWGSMNINELPESGTYSLTLTQLKNDGYLENKVLTNPMTNEEMNGCVKITFDDSNNQYTYLYVDEGC